MDLGGGGAGDAVLGASSPCAPLVLDVGRRTEECSSGAATDDPDPVIAPDDR